MSALTDMTFPELVALNTRLLADVMRMSQRGWQIIGDATAWQINETAARDVLAAAAQVRAEMTRRTTP